MKWSFTFSEYTHSNFSIVLPPAGTLPYCRHLSDLIYDLRDFFYRVVDVFFRVIPSEAHPDRAMRLFGRKAGRDQHVRRIEGSGSAGRAGRDRRSEERRVGKEGR